MQAEHRIRRANLEDEKVVCEILASAFADDPVMAWMSGHPEIYASLFQSEARSLYLGQNHVFVNEAETGAAMWLPPHVSHSAPLHWSFVSVLWKLFSTGGMRSVKRGFALERIFDQHHFKDPHYYLLAIGAAQGSQGQGIGSALLKAGLEICDQHRFPAYLESSNEVNNALYQRFGFSVIDEVELPEDGPTVWTMLREAR